jgi:hypothetical protein
MDATDRRVVGMVHLPALPGAPAYGGDREAVRARAVRDARALAAGGADACIVENFGDAPFHPDDVPGHVVASMTDIVGAVRRAVDLPVGVNVLRSDGPAAVAVAAAAGASFVRVNVHAGVRVTDQGIVEGRAHETMRLRRRLDADVDVLADVAVKHSSPLGDTDAPGAVARRARDLVDRGRADGLIVSGPGTGRAVERERLRAVADAVDVEVPVFVGSGVTPGTVGDLLEVADGVIVGSALERDGEAGAPVVEERVRDLVAAARGGDQTE